jgi:hypothetical protein
MHPDTKRSPRTTLLLAAVTGITSGAVRAIVGWLLEYIHGNS